MNSDERGILIGMLLGDANLRLQDSRKTAVLTIKHAKRQEQYLRHKAGLLGSVLGGAPPKVADFDNNGFPGVKARKTAKHLRPFRNWLYHGGRKTITRQILDWLTPHGIALWYMDDGNLAAKRRRGKVHAYDLYINCHGSLENANQICGYFREVWGVEFRPHLNNRLYRIRCGTIQARLFIDIIRRFIIPEMAYKIAISECRSTSARPSLPELVMR